MLLGKKKRFPLGSEKSIWFYENTITSTKCALDLNQEFISFFLQRVG
jgi:hypothetical protein